jgi:hypothetical protein
MHGTHNTKTVTCNTKTVTYSTISVSLSHQNRLCRVVAEDDHGHLYVSGVIANCRLLAADGQSCVGTVDTLFLHGCYAVVTLLLHRCYTVVTLSLHCCYTHAHIHTHTHTPTLVDGRESFQGAPTQL